MSRCHTARRALCGAVLIGLAACGAPRTDVEADWLQTMERLRMTGIYPPTEDLQPGDVLLDMPAEVGSQPTLRRLGSLPMPQLTTALERQEGRRLRLQAGQPLTGTAATPVIPPPASGVPPHVLAADAGFGAGEPRLRRVAMPAVTAGRITEAQLAGAGPLGNTTAIAAALGLRTTNAVWVRIKNAEMLGFDDLDALRVFRDGRQAWIREQLEPSNLMWIVAMNAPGVARRICEGAPAPADRAAIRIVNRVLYGHTLEYEFSRNSVVAGRFAAELAQAQAAQPLVPSAAVAPQAPTVVQISTPAPGVGAVADPRLDAVLAQMEQLRAAVASRLVTPTTPGVTASLSVGTFGNAAISETTPRPLAVAYVPLVSYPVRGSLLVTERGEAASQQLDRLRRFCTDVAVDRDAKAAYAAAAEGGGPLTPIEAQVCENTRDTNARFGDGWELPARCQTVAAALPRRLLQGQAGLVLPQGTAARQLSR